MQFFRRLLSATLIVLLGAGCVSRKPLRVVPAQARVGVRVVDTTPQSPSGYSSANSRALQSAAAQSGLIPGLILTASAESVEGKGVPWVNSIRAKSGIYEADLLVESVRERLHDLNRTSTAAAGTAPTLEVLIKEAGLAELQRGGFYGVFGTAQARLRTADNKELWQAEARSTSTRLRQRADYDANPALYAEDLREVARDLARQLIDGPIR